MKIRMDFVTNSSSSSFIAWVKLSFDNGKELRLIGQQKDEGDGERAIILPETHYDVGYLDGSFLRNAAYESIQELISFLEQRISNNREMRFLFAKEKEEFFQNAKRVASGKLRQHRTKQTCDSKAYGNMV